MKEYSDAIPYKQRSFGTICHPLIHTSVLMFKQGEEPTFVTKKNWKQLLQRFYDEWLMPAKSVNEVFWLIHKPFRMPIFIVSQSLYREREFNKLLRQVWTDTEFPHENSLSDLIGLFEKTNPKRLMRKSEYCFYEKLPAVVTAYRGIFFGRRHTKKGLSWTLDEKRARWFALRLADAGMLLKAVIPKKAVYAYINSRNEKELIVNPYKIAIVNEEPLVKQRVLGENNDRTRILSDKNGTNLL